MCDRAVFPSLQSFLDARFWTAKCDFIHELIRYRGKSLVSFTCHEEVLYSFAASPKPILDTQLNIGSANMDTLRFFAEELL